MQSPPTDRQRAAAASSSWWSLWDSDPRTAYHAELRRRHEQPTRRTRVAQPTATDGAEDSHSQERGEDNQQQPEGDPVELHSWHQSSRSRITETRTTTRHTRSYCQEMDMWEESTVYQQSRSTSSRVDAMRTSHTRQTWQDPSQRRQRRDSRYRHAHPQPVDPAAEITPSRPSPYEQHLVRSIYPLAYTRSTGHAVGLSMWYLWTSNHQDSWSSFGYKRVVLRCAGLIGFAETTLNGRLSHSISIWSIVCAVVFKEWPRLFLEMTWDFLHALGFRFCERTGESLDVD
ncbi:hypothetical protein B0T16DRAFT_418400 [Cercophora newfieldiana]|uniref:Uncharacterized protein n=1 Tax=Cercophora newfieldiana TaxID=92897 RepID=A0AA39XUZ2_9PEZI|nr:hypothetical protein B0T16DRAFT_418400 [Cercophora newfieldiana]